MAFVRSVPKSGDDPSPYDDAKRLLLIEDSDCIFEQADLRPMIEAGRRMGWPEALIRANEELQQRGRCFKFEIQREPCLNGTLFEDNVMFELSNSTSDEDALREINRLATQLNLKVFHH